MKSILLLLFYFQLSYVSAQQPYELQDGRDGKYCYQLKSIINSKPKEILFGIDFFENGDVYLIVSNKEWFDKIFSYANGITIDVITKEKYKCNTEDINGNGLFKGIVLAPLYKQNFDANLKFLDNGAILLKVGHLPKSLLNKEIEGNLAILNGNIVCYYQKFINIPRSTWSILPMGFYTDSLINPNNTQTGIFHYQKKFQTAILFSKNKYSFKESVLNQIIDSLDLRNFIINRIEIRSYASIEGSLKTNVYLMNKRAEGIIEKISTRTPEIKQSSIIASENWVDFFTDIRGTEYEYLLSLSKSEIKNKLLDTGFSKKLEPYFIKERKAIITLYVSPKNEYSKTKNNDIVDSFDLAIRNKNINKARVILKEIAARIYDNKLPNDYLNQLEIPFEKENVQLLNDKEVYEYDLNQTPEEEVIEKLNELKKLTNDTGHINYNISAITLHQWNNDSNSIIPNNLLEYISNLPVQGIDQSLVKRLLINYHILLSNYCYSKGKYEEKDNALQFIKETYQSLNLTDEDIYALAKYFAYYSQFNWAESLVDSRIDKINVNEDLLFYYINLQFYHPENFSSEKFQKAILNAENLNLKRFCNFFKPNDKGGASIQLLDNKIFRTIYCESCSTK